MANLRAASALLLCCMLGKVCAAQETKTDYALSELQRGSYGKASPAQIAQAKAGGLIAVLKDLFGASTAPGVEWQADVAVNIASELVLLGDHDALYWDYLVRRALPSIESDEPDFAPASGQPGPSAAYEAWKREHPADAPQLSWYAVQSLGLSGDARAIPLLRRALLSPNSSIQNAAVMGLGELGNKESIPLIVAAIRKRDTDGRAALAQTLQSYFNDPAAKAAAAPFLPREKTPSEQGEEAFAKLEAGDDSQALAEQLARAHFVRAVPLLKSRFQTETDRAKKLTLASVLVRFGVADGVYWDYLAEAARPVVECDAPDWIASDAEGKPVRPPEFVAWAEKHHVDLTDGQFFYSFAAPLVEVAVTGDPRGRALLAQALESHMSVVQVIAAQGLAQIFDKESLRVLIEASRRGPERLSELIAFSALIHFDDPEAQAEAARHQGDAMKAQWPALVKEVRGHRPFDGGAPAQP